MKAAQREHTFDRWLREHRTIFFKVVRSYAFTREDQEDLFQEIILQVWKSVPTFRRKSSEVTWLYRIALNTALMWSEGSSFWHLGLISLFFIITFLVGKWEHRT